MLKKILLVSILGLFLMGAWRLARSEQNELNNSPDYSQRLRVVEEKLDTLSKNVDTALGKLNSVLNNQQKILAELNIVKVRATRK